MAKSKEQIERIEEAQKRLNNLFDKNEFTTDAVIDAHFEKRRVIIRLLVLFERDSLP